MKKGIGVQKLFRLAREERGAELVEFAFSALISIGLVLGVIVFGIAMYTYHYLSSAAQAGVRFAQVRGGSWSSGEAVNCSTSAPPNFAMVYDCTASSTDIENYVQSLATGGINPSKVNVTTTWPGTNPDGTTAGCTTGANSKGCMVIVQVSYTVSFVPLLTKLAPLTLQAKSEGAILQ